VFPPNDTDKGVHIFIILCESVGKRYVVIKNYVVCTDKSHPLGTSLGVFPLNGTDEGVRIFSMVFVNVDRRDMAIKYKESCSMDRQQQDQIVLGVLCIV